MIGSIARRANSVVGLLVALLSLTLVAPASATAARPAPKPGITPGSQMLTVVGDDGTSSCTANFVFSNSESVYLGYAAHCAIPIYTRGRNGCEQQTLPLGTTVKIVGPGGDHVDGSLAYSSWRTMQIRGETDPNTCQYNDFALVKIDAADSGAIDPSIPGLGGPTGIDLFGPGRLDPITSFEPNQTIPAVKKGVNLITRGDGWLHRVHLSPSSEPGDSGSGLVNARGAAFGLLVTRYLDKLSTSGVTDLPLALDYAVRNGQLGDLSLVPGTAPFKPPASFAGYRRPAS